MLFPADYTLGILGSRGTILRVVGDYHLNVTGTGSRVAGRLGIISEGDIALPTSVSLDPGSAANLGEESWHWTGGYTLNTDASGPSSTTIHFDTGVKRKLSSDDLFAQVSYEALNGGAATIEIRVYARILIILRA